MADFDTLNPKMHHHIEIGHPSIAVNIAFAIDHQNRQQKQSFFDGNFISAKFSDPGVVCHPGSPKFLAHHYRNNKGRAICVALVKKLASTRNSYFFRHDSSTKIFEARDGVTVPGSST